MKYVPLVLLLCLFFPHLPLYSQHEGHKPTAKPFTSEEKRDASLRFILSNAYDPSHGAVKKTSDAAWSYLHKFDMEDAERAVFFEQAQRFGDSLTELQCRLNGETAHEVIEILPNGTIITLDKQTHCKGRQPDLNFKSFSRERHKLLHSIGITSPNVFKYIEERLMNKDGIQTQANIFDEGDRNYD